VAYLQEGGGSKNIGTQKSREPKKVKFKKLKVYIRYKGTK